VTERPNRDWADDVPSSFRPEAHAGPDRDTGTGTDTGVDPLADLLAEVDGSGAGATRAPAGRRRFDPGGPVAGSFFLAVAGVFLASGLSERNVVKLSALIPAVLIGLGVVGIVRIVTRARRRDPR
jgi:hypothetical protein